MHLLLAMLIGLVVFGRIWFDKCDVREVRKAYDESRAEMTDQYSKFISNYTDPKYESMCAKCIAVLYSYNPNIREGCALDSKDPMAMKYADIYAELQSMFGGIPSKDMVLMGMMADSGKIPQKFAKFGIAAPIRAIPEYETVNQLRFIRWYNKKLRARGVNQDIVFVPRMIDAKKPFENLNYRNHKERCINIHDITNPRERGTYIWWDSRLNASPYGEVVL